MQLGIIGLFTTEQHNKMFVFVQRFLWTTALWT